MTTEVTPTQDPMFGPIPVGSYHHLEGRIWKVIDITMLAEELYYVLETTRIVGRRVQKSTKTVDSFTMGAAKCLS